MCAPARASQELLSHQDAAVRSRGSTSLAAVEANLAWALHRHVLPGGWRMLSMETCTAIAMMQLYKDAAEHKIALRAKQQLTSDGSMFAE